MKIFIALSLLTALLWGAIDVIDRIVLNKLSTTTLFCFKAVGFTIAFVVIALFNHKNMLASLSNNGIIPWKEIGLAALSTLIGISALLIFLTALSLTKNTPILSALAYTCPIFTLALSLLFIKGFTISMSQIFAVLLTITGVVLVVMTTK